MREGFRVARGQLIGFVDADYKTPIEEIDKLLPWFSQGFDIAIGSRWLESTRQTIRQPWYRQLFGRCFNLLTRLVNGWPKRALTN